MLCRVMIWERFIEPPEEDKRSRRFHICQSGLRNRNWLGSTYAQWRTVTAGHQKSLSVDSRSILNILGLIRSHYYLLKFMNLCLNIQDPKNPKSVQEAIFYLTPLNQTSSIRLVQKLYSSSHFWHSLD